MANTKHSGNPFPTRPSDHYARLVEKYSSPLILPHRTSGENHKTEIEVHYEGVSLTDTLNKGSQPLAGRGEKENCYDRESGEADAGRIQSIRHEKNGAYICSKCEKPFPTSQKFATHTSKDHYKFESEDQRRRRLDSKFKRRNLSLQKVSDGITLIPISSKAAGIENVAEQGGKVLDKNTETSTAPRVAHHGGEGLTMKVKVESDHQDHDEVAPL